MGGTYRSRIGCGTVLGAAGWHTDLCGIGSDGRDSHCAGDCGIELGDGAVAHYASASALGGMVVASSTLGMAIGLTLGVIVVEQISRAIFGGPVNFRMLGVAARSASFGCIGLIGGAALGVAQWLVLRRQAAKCSRWIYVNALSLGAGLACGSLLADALMLRTGSLGSTAVLLVIGSSAAGVCTARSLAGIFAPRVGQASATHG